MSKLADFKKWAEKNRKQIRDDYFHFLRFRSISTDPAYKEDSVACSRWLADFIASKAGMKTERIETEGQPLVYAEDLSAGPHAPTLLIYGHYDVQPVDPIELWKSDPFEPTERNGLVYARGALDDKGQIYYAVLAVRCWKELGRSLPINLKFCIEGEEESMSLGLAKALPKIGAKLRADYLLIPDFGQPDKDTPAMSMGGRGLVALELILTGSKGDLHSGCHGGLAYNPNRAMVELLSKLWDEKGRVQVPGFYDGVVELNAKEQADYTFTLDPEKYRQEFGIEALGGEKGKSMKEANYFRPTLEINGLSGGYAGAGFKTVIPACAVAKISCRLVPNQDPKKILHNLQAFLKKQAKEGMKVEIHPMGADFAFRGDPDSKLAQAVSQAVKEVNGKNCEKILSGGSIRIVAELVKQTGAQVVGMGYGLAEDNIHAPERIV